MPQSRPCPSPVGYDIRGGCRGERWLLAVDLSPAVVFAPSDSTSFLIPCSHSLRCSALILDAPALLLFENSETAVRISPLLGVSSHTSNRFSLDMDQETWGVTPPVEVDPLRSLPIHCLEAWTGLGVGCRLIPSFQMAEGLLDVPSSTNFLRPRIPVCA